MSNKKSNPIGDALLALCDEKKKVEYPKFPHDIYVRPIPLSEMMLIQVKQDEESEVEYARRIELESSAYSLCDKDGNQLFDKDQYSEFIKKLPFDIGLAIGNAKLELNSFDHLDADSKKK